MASLKEVPGAGAPLQANGQATKGGAARCIGGRNPSFWKGLLEDDRQKEKGEPTCRIATSRLSEKKMKKLMDALNFNAKMEWERHPSKIAIDFIFEHKSELHPADIAELASCGMRSHEYVRDKSIELIPFAAIASREALLMKAMGMVVREDIVQMFALAEEGALKRLVEKLLSIRMVFVNPVIWAMDYALRYPEEERAEIIGRMMDAGGQDVMRWAIMHMGEVPAKDRAGLLKKGFGWWTSRRDITGDVLGALDAVPIEDREGVLEAAMKDNRTECKIAAIRKIPALLPERQEGLICSGLDDRDSKARKASVEAIKLAPIEARARLVKRALWSINLETADAAWEIRGCAPKGEMASIMAVRALAKAFPTVESGFGRMIAGAVRKVDKRNWDDWVVFSAVASTFVGLFGGIGGCVHQFKSAAEKKVELNVLWFFAPAVAPFALMIGFNLVGYGLAYSGQIFHDFVKDYSKWARFRLTQFARLPSRLAAAGARKARGLFTDGKETEAGENA